MSGRPSRSSAVSTVLWTTAFTAGFYAVGTAIPGIAANVERYFCGHPLKYISTVMFFSGLTILIQKSAGLRLQKTAITKSHEVANSIAEENLKARESLQRWQNWMHQDGSRHADSAVYQRVRDTLQYLKASQSSGLEEHLRYLAELASEKLHQTYAAVRTITWAIPILGFLGTVIGITMAIANVTPEQLDTSLNEVTQGLAMAFDTTALALSMSIVLVFASFLVERSEQQLLSRVEQFGIEFLLPAFSNGSATSGGAQSQNFNPGQLQSAVWEDQIVGLRQVWSDVLQQHAGQLSEAVDAEVQQTLQLHRETADDARDAYRQALHESAHQIVDEFANLTTTFSDRVTAWQDAMLTSSQSSVEQSEALHQLGATLLRMTESEERLAALQQQLNENLNALQVAETMEQTANSLAAAVHVLTAKASSRNAA